MDKSTVMKNYRFLALMLFAMVAGCVAGWFFPEFGHFIKPAGTVFINMMFCVVVPLVFASISNSVASVRSRKRAGKIMGTTVLTFVVTGAVAAIAAADALVVGGTSLVVYPAAGLTRYFTGDTLAICNLAPTDQDANADLLISCDIAAAFAF